MQRAMSGPPAVEGPERARVPAAPGYPSRTDFGTELDTLEDGLGFDIAAVLARAVELELLADAAGEPVLAMRARLLQADMLQRQGETTTAARLLRDVEGWAGAHGCDPLRARIDRLLARIYYALGDVAACLEHAVLAVQRLDPNTSDRTRAAYLMALAGALNAAGSYDAARERYQQAERFAVTAGDVPRHLAVLNNQAYSELEAGEADRAWEVVLRLQEVAAEHDHELNPNYLDTVAQVQIALGWYADAERTTQASIEAFSSAWEEEVDSLTQSLATLAVAQTRLGKIEPAQETLDRCRRLCDELGLTTMAVRVIQEQAELYAVSGDYQRAFDTYKKFHTAHSQLISQQGEARARTRQAMFETAEALQNAAHFHDQARRDQLTSLPNRRYIDEALPPMIADSARTGAPLVVAFVDVDHFKRVNDTCSHQVGDQVLVAIAELLAAAVPPGAGFAARSGGEEFLLVLAEKAASEVTQRLEALRHAVAAHDWRPLTGELPVTVSIGATMTTPDSTQRSLFARADELLYAAKRGGRNRVHFDG